MNARAFFDLVANMRAAQIGFFKSPKGSQERQGFYKQSKDLEAAVEHFKQVRYELERNDTSGTWSRHNRNGSSYS